MFLKTTHAAINLTPGETPLSIQFHPLGQEEGWYWGEVEDAVGTVLLAVDPAFQEIGGPVVEPAATVQLSDDAPAVEVETVPAETREPADETVPTDMELRTEPTHDKPKGKKR